MMKMKTAILATGTKMTMMVKAIGAMKTIMTIQVTMAKTNTMRVTMINMIVEEVTVEA
jgi:hypothetical protein